MTPEDIAKQKAALDTRQAELDARDASFAAEATTRREADNAAFAETLIKDGRLLPANKDSLVGVLNSLPASAEVSFSGDDGSQTTQNAADALKALMTSQPVLVDFSAQDMSDDPGVAGKASFASDGQAFDQDQLALHQKAQTYMTQNPGTAYIDAVQAVS